MKFKYILFFTLPIALLISLIIGCGGSSNPDKSEQTVMLGWISLDSSAKEGDVPNTVIKESSTRGMTVNFTIPGIKVYEIKENNAVYHHLEIPEAGVFSDVGKPELPMIGKMIEVPKNTNISIEITKSAYKEIDGYHIYPAQRPTYDYDEDELFDASDEFIIDKEAYLKDTFFPQKISSINDKSFGVIRGHRVLSLKINPVQYNPVTKKTRVYYDVDVKVKYDRSAKIEPVNERIHSYEFEKMLQSHLLNHEGLRLIDPERIPVRTGCDYLILTTPDFYNPQDANNPIVKFRQWKEQKGLITWVRDVSNMTADAIKKMMQSIYNTWDPVPEYLLIVGDVEFVPTNYIPRTTTETYDNNKTVDITKFRATDMPYVQVDGDNWYPDIMMGRLSVDTLEEANITITKIINYEKNPPQIGYFYQKATLVGLFQDYWTYELNGTKIYKSDGKTEKPYIKDLEIARSFLLSSEGNKIDRFYKAPSESSPTYYKDNTLLPVDIQASSGFKWHWLDDEINQMIQNKINEGRFLVDFRGHGGCMESNDLSGFFNQSNIYGLSNGNLTPVVFAINCGAGRFDTETNIDYKNYATSLYKDYKDHNQSTGYYYYKKISYCDHNDGYYNYNAARESLAEAFLRYGNGGAVAVVAASRSSNNPPNEHINYKLIESTMNDNITIGATVKEAMLYMDSKVNSSIEDLVQINAEIYHLFGDPEMSIYTKIPYTFSKPNFYEDEQRLYVNILDIVSAESAQVTMMQNGLFVTSKRTNEKGEAEFNLENLQRGLYDIIPNYAIEISRR